MSIDTLTTNKISILLVHLIPFTFILPRLVASLLFLPSFNKQIMPTFIRNGIVFSLALFVFPLVSSQAPEERIDLLHGGALFIKETVIGLIIGFSTATLFWSIESAGFFIDNQRGSSMASSLNPLTGSDTSPLGILFTQTLSTIFFISGGFLLFLGMLYESYRLWPVFSFFPHLKRNTAVYFLHLLDQVMALAVLTAAPALIAMFLSEFALGLVSRFTPQLNVFFLAMPVKSAVGLFVLVAYALSLFGFYGDELLHWSIRFRAISHLIE